MEPKDNAIEADRQRSGEPVALQLMAVSEYGQLRWLTGRKHPKGIASVELYAMPDFGTAPTLYAAPQPAEMQDSSDRFRIAFEEWHDKTNFVQDWIKSGKLPAKYLGWHRADVLRDLVENGASQPAEPVKAPTGTQIESEWNAFYWSAMELHACERKANLDPLQARFVQYMLSRYGAQPAASAEPFESWAARQDVAWTHAERQAAQLAYNAAVVAAQPHLYDGDTLTAAYMAGQDAARVPEGWRPIQTAPKDGTPLLLFARASCATASIDMFGWYSEGRGWIAQSICGQDIVDIVPSHWMPRPPFPVGEIPLTHSTADEYRVNPTVEPKLDTLPVTPEEEEEWRQLEKNNG